MKDDLDRPELTPDFERYLRENFETKEERRAELSRWIEAANPSDAPFPSTPNPNRFGEWQTDARRSTSKR